jgi:hypothetical protein
LRAVRVSHRRASTRGWSRPQRSTARARGHEAYAVASLFLADLDAALDMARQVEAAGIPVLEFNMGTPYAKEAKGVVAIELDPAHITALVETAKIEF